MEYGETMTIVDDYIDYCDEYTKKYGERTVVLMQVGSFHECYAVSNDVERSGADIVTICDLLNIQLSRKNKMIIENSRGNPLMAGFPISSQAKHTQTLLSNNFTVVMINQVTPPPNPKREVTEILSPGLQLTPPGAEGSWLIVSYWDISAAGFCGLDVSTGQSWVYEVAGTSLCLDEMSRCVSMYQPKEVVVIASATMKKDAGLCDSVIKTLGSVQNTHLLWDAAHAPGTKYANVAYQNEVLKKAYASLSFGMLSPIEALDLERMDNVRTALVFAIQFSYEHNPTIIQHLQKPSHLSFDCRCNLEHTSATQLQLVAGGGGGGGKHERPLLSILSRCATAFGCRAFKSRLLQPTHDQEVLKARYDEIETCMRNTDFMAVHNALRGVLDIERIARRIRLGTFNPTDWVGFDMSLKNIKTAAAATGGGLGDVVAKIMAGYENTLDVDQCAKYLIGDIKSNVFLQGVHVDVDETVARCRHASDSISLICDNLNKFGEGCKVDFSDRDGYSLMVTKRRWDAIKLALPDGALPCDVNIKTSTFTARPVSSSSSIVRLTHPFITEQSDLIVKLTSVIADKVTILYKSFLSRFADEYSGLLETCVKLTSDLDVVVTCARNATDFNYTRPTIAGAGATDGGGGPRLGAWFDAVAMRHPILERLNDRVMYVPNDVSLGGGRAGGLLLFGVNSSGKSSLMKAIGLNVIMAQAGMFVACDSFVYSPYRHVFTRIAGSDDIYRGWSTFTVEMMELRNILMRSDAYSLVLGDELCSGTESLSATAIVASGIETLCKSKVSFVFATHLHDLSKMKRITERPDVVLAHMHVEWQKDCLVYDRRMRPGVGSGVYGLEVCRGLDLPADFLKTAHEVRCELSDTSPFFIDPKTSRYNSSVFMDICKICKATSSTETHHIVPQALANSGSGSIGHYSKDAAFNLLPVCGKCHDIIHNGKGHLSISGYIATTSGLQLDLQSATKPVTKKLRKKTYAGVPTAIDKAATTVLQV